MSINKEEDEERGKNEDMNILGLLNSQRRGRRGELKYYQRARVSRTHKGEE